MTYRLFSDFRCNVGVDGCQSVVERHFARDRLGDVVRNDAVDGEVLGVALEGVSLWGGVSGLAGVGREYGQRISNGCWNTLVVYTEACRPW